MRDAIKNLARGCGGVHLLRLEPAQREGSRFRSATCPGTGYEISRAAQEPDTHSSSTNLALNMVRTMSAITCASRDASPDGAVVRAKEPIQCSA
jgi:hypothetical protein